MSDCCAPGSGGYGRPIAARLRSAPNVVAAGDRSGGPMVSIPGGTFQMGADDAISYPEDGEGPVRPVTLSPFQIDVHAVTNAEFAIFVERSGYRTEAEREGWSFVFGGLLPDDFAPTRGAADAPWWRRVEGACWSHPEGAGTSVVGREDHPVVHVSWADAAAYAAWAGRGLPSEAQWECAARGGLDRRRYPWGDELEPGGEHRMNVWQGDFPSRNTQDDGWYGTCPADTFPANDYGLRNMTGNVWEWCVDWFDVNASVSQDSVDPTGPPDGDLRVLKGGSFLCHASYCARYRPAARMGLPPDSSTSNVGFRCSRPGTGPALPGTVADQG